MGIHACAVSGSDRSSNILVIIICMVSGLFLAPGAWFDRRAYKPADRNLINTGTSGTLKLVWLEGLADTPMAP
jgi:hypothetical protein